MKRELRCDRDLHNILVEGGIEPVIERHCRHCSRHLSEPPRIKREVYHRWTIKGDRLKDRVVKWVRAEEEPE